VCQFDGLVAQVEETPGRALAGARLGALLTPRDSVLLLIDNQVFQFANLHSHEPTLVVNNVVGLATTSKSVAGADHWDHGSGSARGC
jgi:hypothetical protein